MGITPSFHCKKVLKVNSGGSGTYVDFVLAAPLWFSTVFSRSPKTSTLLNTPWVWVCAWECVSSSQSDFIPASPGDRSQHLLSGRKSWCSMFSTCCWMGGWGWWRSGLWLCCVCRVSAWLQLCLCVLSMVSFFCFSICLLSLLDVLIVPAWPYAAFHTRIKTDPEEPKNKTK